MKTITPIFIFSLITLFASCSKEDPELPVVDNEGPEIHNLRWIDSPFYEGDPSGPIEDGENYMIGIDSRFQFNMDILDASNIEIGNVYFLVNNDPDIKETFISEGTIFGYKEGSIGIIYDIFKIALGGGEFYHIQEGDKFNFYVEFTDEHGNTSSISWTADIVE